MATYQIPQFLESGDKILGPLNVRQFGYALGGFFVSILIFTLTQSAFPTIGFYAILPAIPVLGLTAYIALGKYNGRDSEIYILKFILFNVKPRTMIYQRYPNNSDLDEKLATLTTDKITKEWASRVVQIKQLEKNELMGFDQMNAEERADKIRAMGTKLDMGFYNTLHKVRTGQLKLVQQQAVLTQLTQKPNKSGTPITNTAQNSRSKLSDEIFPVTNPVLLNEQSVTDESNPHNVNFFDTE